MAKNKNNQGRKNDNKQESKRNDNKNENKNDDDRQVTDIFGLENLINKGPNI